MQPKKPLAVFLYVFATALFFITLGLLLVCLCSLLYNAILRSNLVLKPGSNAYNIWVKNPIPFNLKLYVFNWTNPTDIYNSTIKPKFQQLGPYTYVETKEKANITWNANNTVTYRILKKWWFDEKNSNGSLMDPFTTVNPVAFSAAYASRNWHYLVKKGLSLTLKTMVNSVATTQSVGQTLFEGYRDPLLGMVSSMPFLSMTKIHLTNKFGWFYGRNGSYDFEGIFSMNTGTTGQLGVLQEWNYSNHTPFYPNTCGQFNGASAGDFFPTDLTKASVVKFFSADLCRYVELEFEKEVVINGLVGYKYSAGDRFLDNGTKVPENRCFCDGNCMPSGALNISNCRYGSPSFVSLPHFYKADPYYLENIEGLKPDSNKSDFYMVFEPNTGVPLQVAARLQLNLRLQPLSDITFYQNVPTVFFPVIYFEQVVTIPENITFLLNILVNFKIICYTISIILILIGVLIFACACYKICTTKTIFGAHKPKKNLPEEVPLKH